MVNIDIAVDLDSAVPPYEQVRLALAERIADGSLPVGTRLPTVRAVATATGLAVNTVARAYRELEAAGLVSTHGRAGTVVAAAGDRARESLQQAAVAYVERSRALGFGDDETLTAVRAALST